MQKQLSQRWRLLLAVAGCGSASVAAAAPGDHIGNEQVEVIPSVGVMGGWRSNVYLQEGELGGGEPTVAGSFVELSPGIELNVDSSDFKLGVDATYRPRMYLDQTLQNLNRFTFFDVGGSASLFPSSVVGLKVSDRFYLTGRETEAESADWAYLTVLNNQARGFLSIRPGSSMEIAVGGEASTTDYKTDAGTNPLVETGAGTLGLAQLNRRVSYGPAAEFEWKFLPKTALVANYSQQWFNWNNNFLYARGDGLNPSEANDFDAYLGVPDGMELRASAGLRGRFTERVVLGLEFGYVKLTYDEQSVISDATDSAAGVDLSNDIDAAGQGFDVDLPSGLNAEVEVGYDLSEENRLTVAYRRDFADIYFSNFLAYHQYSIRYDGLIADRIVPEFSASLRQETYQGEIARRDNFIRFKGDLGYRVTKALDLSGGVWWTQRASVDAAGEELQPADPSIEYDDVNVHLGLVFTY